MTRREVVRDIFPIFERLGILIGNINTDDWKLDHGGTPSQTEEDYYRQLVEAVEEINKILKLLKKLP